jgi:hypothetical protein
MHCGREQETGLKNTPGCGSRRDGSEEGQALSLPAPDGRRPTTMMAMALVAHARSGSRRSHCSKAHWPGPAEALWAP